MLINDAMQQGMPQKPMQQEPMSREPMQQKPMPAGSQDLLRKLGLNAMQIIYDDQASNSLVDAMKAGAGDPITAVAHAALAVLEGVKKSVKNADPNSVYAVSKFVIVWLLELAEAAKLFETDISMVDEVLKVLEPLTNEAQQGTSAQPPQRMPAQQQQMMPQGA